MNFDELRMIRVRVRAAAEPLLDARVAVPEELGRSGLRQRLRPGMQVAIAVGSRGITGLQTIVGAVLDWLREIKVRPFIVPAMGSHGGATAAGQRAILAGYGITEQALGVPLLDSTEVICLGETADGAKVWFSRTASEADAILLINRVKPHTDFAGDLGSGLLKMLVVGLGKAEGASAFHQAAMRCGHLPTLYSMGEVMQGRVPLVGGLALVEGASHQTVKLEYVDAAALVARERELVAIARQCLPRLPVRRCDLLIVDRMGKDISGTGMDTNVIGRSVQGYVSFAEDPNAEVPAIGRLYVRELTPGSGGNAIGVGMADFCSERLVRAMDAGVTRMNALTALSIQAAKVPLAFATDREAVAAALRTLALPADQLARVVRIRDTLTPTSLEVSEACLSDEVMRDPVECLGPPRPMCFDASGHLPAWQDPTN